MPAPAFLYGVALSLAGCCLLSLGLNVEKLSILKNARRPLALQRVFWKQPVWLLGFAVFLAGNVLNALALGYASASLLAPLGSCSIIANLLASCSCWASLASRSLSNMRARPNLWRNSPCVVSPRGIRPADRPSSITAVKSTWAVMSCLPMR